MCGPVGCPGSKGGPSLRSEREDPATYTTAHEADKHTARDEHSHELTSRLRRRSWYEGLPNL